MPERARRVLSKLRQVPRLMQAARDNIKDPPGIFIKVGLESLRGTLALHRGRSAARALGGSTTCTCSATSPTRRPKRRTPSANTSPTSKTSSRRAPAARSASAASAFEQKLLLDEGIPLDHERLLAIATRELQATQDEFRRVAARLDAKDPLAAWARAKHEHPAAGRVVATAQEQLEELKTFIQRQDLVSLPASAPVQVAPTPRFYRWTFASMWTPGPFETRPLRAYYYITDADPVLAGRAAGRAPARSSISARCGRSRSTRCIPATSSTTSICARSPSTLRKSILFSSTAMVEGWAHYSEQMMVEAGFRRQDPAIKLGQLAESLIRLCRLVVGHPPPLRGSLRRAGRAFLP